MGAGGNAAANSPRQFINTITAIFCYMPPIAIRRIEDPTLDFDSSKTICPEIRKAEQVTEDLLEDATAISQPHVFEHPVLVERPQKANTSVLTAVIMIVGGIGLLWFGIFNAGSFYASGTRMSGQLATIFYVWQVGNIMEIIGCILAYNGAMRLFLAYMERRSYV